ncbi:MAG: hypothetical protein Q9212_003102 [Teloschistes hypoglaucus]
MELRKKINPPKRLDDEIAEEAEKAERVLPANVLSGQAYCGKITQPNPNLGPAVFPTLDPRRISIHHDQQRRTLIPSSSQPSPSTAVARNRDSINETVTDAEMSVTRHFHQMHRQPLHTDSQEGRAAPHTDNGPGNPIWEANMKLMEKLGSRTEDEEFMAEMETSDEEDGPARTRVKPSHSAQCPDWDDIALPLQIEMVTSAVDQDGDLMVAYRRLRLTRDQQDVFKAKISQQKDREAADYAAITAHQHTCHQELLKVQKFSQEKFQFILQEHLYKDLTGEDPIVTPESVKLARAYLSYCGLDSSVLDVWVDDDKTPLVIDEDEVKRKNPGAVTVEQAEQMYDRLPWDTPEPTANANEAPPMDKTDGAEFTSKERSTQPRRRPSVPPIIISNPQQSQPVQPAFALKSAVDISPSTRTVVRQITDDTIDVDTNTVHRSVSTNGQSPPALEQPTAKEKSPPFSEEPRTPSPQHSSEFFTPQSKLLPVYLVGAPSSHLVAPKSSAPNGHRPVALNARFSGSESDQPKPKRRRTHLPQKKADTTGPASMQSFARLNAALEAGTPADPASSPYSSGGFGSSIPPTPTPINQGYHRPLAMQQAAPVARMGNTLGQPNLPQYHGFPPGNMQGGEDHGSNRQQTTAPPAYTFNPAVLTNGADRTSNGSQTVSMPMYASNPAALPGRDDTRLGQVRQLVPATRALSVTDLLGGERTEAAVATTEVKPKKKAGRRKKIQVPQEASNGQ